MSICDEDTTVATSETGGPTGVVRVGATEGFGTLMLAAHLAWSVQQVPYLPDQFSHLFVYSFMSMSSPVTPVVRGGRE